MQTQVDKWSIQITKRRQETGAALLLFANIRSKNREYYAIR